MASLKKERIWYMTSKRIILPVVAMQTYVVDTMCGLAKKVDVFVAHVCI